MNVVEMLRHIDDGRVMEDLAQGLALVQMAVCETGAPGKLTLTLKVEPEGIEMAVQRCVILAEVKPQPPLPARSALSVFVHEGSMSLRHPRQPSRVPDGVEALDRQTMASGG